MPAFPNASKVAHKQAAIQLLLAVALEGQYFDHPLNQCGEGGEFYFHSRESFILELQSDDEEDSEELNEEHLQAYVDWRNEYHNNNGLIA